MTELELKDACYLAGISLTEGKAAFAGASIDLEALAALDRACIVCGLERPPVRYCGPGRARLRQ